MVGNILGALLGLINGAVDEALLGMGAVLRIEDGATEIEGVVLDKVVGEALGAIVGLDGTTDGVLLGRILGEEFGAILGLEEGITVGTIAADVGTAVGPVGFTVGVTVGFGYL